jgi:4-hydroxy-tetrahydrodipicolinate synthase
MSKNQIVEKLRGVFVPMITPMDQSERVCEESLARFTVWLVESGVSGVYPASGCGEVWKLSIDERKRLIDVVVDAADRKSLVLPGAGAGATREAIELSLYAQEKGADGVVVWPPFHMGTAYTEDAIFDHYETIAMATDIPIIVYDSPEITCYPLSVELTDRLADIESIVGVKESTGDLDKFARLLRVAGDRISIMQGWDSLLLASLSLGSPGAVLSSANVCPRLVVEIVNAFERGDLESAREKHYSLLSFISSSPWRTDQFQAMKELLNILGLDGGIIRKPWFSLPFGSEDKEMLAESLRSIGMID